MMKKLDLGAAREHAHALVRVDHEKVVKMLTLRAAQVKYVLNRTPLFDDQTLESVKKRIDPPVANAGDALIQYALSTHEEFLHSHKLLLERSTHARENEKWLNELEETLLEMRRIVMQNLSKHPALRPYNLLTKLQDEVSDYEETGTEYAHLLQKKNSLSREIVLLERDAELCRTQPGFDTLRRLNESFDKLVSEKRALNDHWMHVWLSLSEIFKRLAENEDASQEWENAQHRMLHLYLTNPALTREKDVHGQGLVMILRLAVSALETRKKLFKGMNDEDVHTTLLNALENPLFVNYLEHMHALDAAISANQNERNNHPHHKILSDIQQRVSEVQRDHDKVDEEIFRLVQTKENRAKEIQSIWKEANHACQTQLCFELEQIILQQ